MNAVILCCQTLKDYVLAAQKACAIDYPVIELDRSYHVEPARMKAHILEALNDLPETFDTVLVAMGFCGGSWQDVTSTRRLILPRVDDCVSLVMTHTDEVRPNTKQMGHMYVFGDDKGGGFSIGSMFEALVKEHGEESARLVFDMMFEGYRNVDIVDTGIYDCYDPAYVESVQNDADLIHAELDFVPGGNLLLEKLASGRWDEQFVVVEPLQPVTQGSFFDL